MSFWQPIRIIGQREPSLDPPDIDCTDDDDAITDAVDLEAIRREEADIEAWKDEMYGK